MMKIYIHGNCQGTLLKRLFAEVRPDWTIYNRQVHIDSEYEDSERYLSELRSADVLITQPISGKYTDTNRSSQFVESEVRHGIPIITFPSIFFRGQIPEWYYLNSTNGRVKSIGMDYHNAHILSSVIKKISLDDCINHILSPDLYTKEFVEKNFNDNINSLIHREKSSNVMVCASDILEERARDQEVMNAINHPRRCIIAPVANRMLEIIGAKERLSENGEDYLPAPRIVISPSVVYHLLPSGYKANSEIVLKKYKESFSKYIEKCYYNYKSVHGIDESFNTSKDIQKFINEYEQYNLDKDRIVTTNFIDKNSTPETNLSIQSQSAATIFELAKKARLSGKNEEAADLFLKFTQINNKDAAGHYELGRSLMSLRKFKEAVFYLERSFEIDSRHVDSLLNIARCLREQGLYKDSINKINHYLKICPQSAAAYHEVGRCLLMEKRHKEALIAFEQAMVLRPGASDVIRSIGVAQSALGNYEKAISAWSSRLRANPNDVITRHDLGRLFLKLLKYKEAIYHLSIVNELSPDRIDAFYEIGDAFMKIKYFDKAKEYFYRVLKADPSHMRARSALDNVLHQKEHITIPTYPQKKSCLTREGMAYDPIATVEATLRYVKDTRTPFSLIRLADGESAFLGYPDYSSLKERNHFLDLWWGNVHISEENCSRLKDAVFGAIKNCDILGMPPKDHPKHQLLRNLHAIIIDHNLYNQHMILTSSLVATHLYQSKFLGKLIHGEQSIGLISPNCELVNILKNSEKIGDVDYVSISGEHKFFGAKQHFPHEYDHIENRIKIRYPGQIWLVGAGICGKVYCDLVKRRGGISLDVGSVLDHWSGKHTRHIHKKWEDIIKR